MLKQRRRQLDPATRFLAKLIGLEAKMNQYEQGERFIEAVEAAGGPELLHRAFDAPQNLPTLDEIRAPEPLDRPGAPGGLGGVSGRRERATA